MTTQSIQTTYANPPIQEAIIHISSVGTVDPSELERYIGPFEQDYPFKENLAGQNFMINVTGGGINLAQNFQGFRLSNVQQTDVLLALLDGVAVARAAPYLGWEQLREKAQFAWRRWRTLQFPSAVKRIGVRYVNRLDIPTDQSSPLDIEKYLNFFPHVPKSSLRPVNGYVMQVVLPTEIELWSASLTSMVVTPAPLIDTASIVLDLDIFRTQDIPANENDLWDAIESVRVEKNRIFEACIRSPARELFLNL